MELIKAHGRIHPSDQTDGTMLILDSYVAFGMPRFHGVHRFGHGIIDSTNMTEKMLSSLNFI